MTDDTRSPDEFWDHFYRERSQVWSGRPNALLVREVADLPAGTALDLGCGEGGDAVWLAQQGWRVTAVDISQVALDRGAAAAAGAGVADRIDWQRHELGRSFPDGGFDLVSAAFLHSPVELPRDDVLVAAAGAVNPGGTLLVIGHAEVPPWSRHRPDVPLPGPEEVIAALPVAEGWHVERAERCERSATDPDGQPVTLFDAVVRLTRPR